MLKTCKKLASDVGISESHLRKLQREHLIEGKHFYKENGKKNGKIYFDEGAFFEFIKGSNGECLREERQDMGKLISKWQKDTKADRISLQ